jgi:hypothetical protein
MILSASDLLYKTLIISFAFCVGVKLNFKDVEILVFLAFARMVGFQIGRPVQ